MCLNSITFIAKGLDGIHEGALHLVEDDNTEEQQHQHKSKAVANRRPGEVALTQRSEAESFDNGGHRIGLDQKAQRAFLHHAERINDWRSVHPELDDECKENGEVAIFGRQRRHQNTKTQSQSGYHHHQQWHKRQCPGNRDISAPEEEPEVQDHEQPSLNQEAKQIRNYHSNGDYQSGEIDLPEHVLIGQEGVGRLLQAV